MSRKCILPIVLLLLSLISGAPLGHSTVDHAPIVIDSDSDFVASGYRGSGTRGDPYVVEGLKIVSTGAMSNAIKVVNTEAYFVITGCEIDAGYIGVLIEDVAAGTATVDRNVIRGSTGDGGGIVLGADGVTVTGNNCTGFAEGIHTNYSDDCIIAGNYLGRNGYHGLSLRYSSGNLVVNNTIVGNGAHGVFIIRESRRNVVYNNTLVDNSAIDSYDWDNIYHFDVRSQGADAGSGNTWYREALRLGNTWSDYGGTGTYKIDGTGGAVDRYPTNMTSRRIDTAVAEPAQVGGIPGFPAEATMLGVGLVVLLAITRKRITFGR